MSRVQFNNKKTKYSVIEGIAIKHYMQQTGKFPPALSMMPFGKYKGMKLREIPTGYLDWLNRQPNLKGKVKEQIQSYLEDVIKIQETRPDIKIKE